MGRFLFKITKTVGNRFFIMCYVTIPLAKKIFCLAPIQFCYDFDIFFLKNYPRVLEEWFCKFNIVQKKNCSACKNGAQELDFFTFRPNHFCLKIKINFDDLAQKDTSGKPIYTQILSIILNN
ncbi:hypothetical protein BpHYR1_035625 [Brachionus plicatilis]|uniref:Uncharacterized protein n=1 Tax=Brachionus plicatilis TaxID=10195 RepID=A0A3M7RPS8_BRAPC|nr:hypothetical protein BpHYR1_035625 [Brachionus plicatilis]